ncbi:NAD(P)/FAD-dependent oxidoreductase [Mucilaginibacter sp. KACC 22063]|uniref:NAD(P)/FAD-dependent oxidoreductase n=1 Tax=Mucilaginibacter sp. KACC 22063 TaxID=3025666 RepID=UPI00236686E5|nr:NAD(P)/FAD-dependent oxidoreductase [Mucilaginibacter sp. KACC 22063]WDF54357.1 NAD(P)/FAD-dependent oxidoreductase [Mucilaginibacter sp. KACC 22063]
MKVVIIGAGFAGLRLARKLSNQEGVEVLLIDRNNFHQFQPLLYQVATASLEPSNISFPLRKIFQHSENVRIRIAEVTGLDTVQKLVLTDIGNFEYDQLVIATGTVTNYFGNDAIKQHTLPMKTTLEALQLMNKIINNYEDALDTQSPSKRSSLMSVAIVGAGPTGVELAGALAELKNNVLPKDYPELDIELMNLYLIDRNSRPLKNMSEKSGIDALNYLTDMGVNFMPATGVETYDGKLLQLSNGQSIEVRTVIWAAGVSGDIPPGLTGDVITRGNRLKVDRFNMLEGADAIYAIGDIAQMNAPGYENGHPQLASVAQSQADNLAENIVRMLEGEQLIAYEYYDKGIMATIGKRKAVVDLTFPKWHLKGRLAWFTWMFVHLMLILGVKNKVQIFINWLYKYFTSDQNLRLAQRANGRIKSLEIIGNQID